MNRLSRHLAIGVVAGVCVTAAQAQIILYEHEDFKGRSIRGTDVVKNLRDSDFNDKASSIKVLTGTWEICSDANFRGDCQVLEPGQYRALRDMGMNDRLSSLRRVSDGQRGGYGGGYGGGTRPEYQRGYNDALNGRQFDNDRHPQDYKDGFRAGEDARRGGLSANTPAGGYEINRLSNGGFEVVWPQRGCIGSFNSRGEPLSFNENCNDDLIGRSRDIARRER
ncbi:MAG: beta/gamma crystallin family protein [Burkholderiaceae bacterium]|jgi:hypothetical protein|nr:beta/gamma crystallin family protein [Burkholderiaceae bacterium]